MAQPAGDSGQWPGPSAPAERRADEVKEAYADTGTRETPEAPEQESAEAPEQESAARIDGGAPNTVPADLPETLLDPARTEDLRRRWDAIKASFVDDPHEAVRRAETLAEEVVRELTDAVEARRRDLADRRAGMDGQDDKARTERLRVVLHGYQTVLDPVLRT
ncbi:MAG TPA: hypothetical protein VF069_23280 [Streptosporangiaceae bacterium]